ncbi:MAG: SMP-30/gluconolactonase/LRE family protein [Pseudomonadota bacterium]|nr:SMP-30/gluconolactonase/LRE family protein [Pseudomonadota bacterium]
MLNKKLVLIAAALTILSGNLAAKDLRVVKGLSSPESVMAADDGRIFVSQIGGFGVDGDGSIAIIGKDGQISTFATGLDDPKGFARHGDFIYVADKMRVWKIDKKGKVTVFAPASAFPAAPQFLNDVAIDAKGNVYVSDSGDTKVGGGGAIFSISPDGVVSVVTSHAEDGRVKSPNGLLVDRGSLLAVDFASGELYRIDLQSPHPSKKLAGGFGGGDGLALDRAGNLHISDWKNGKVFRLNLKKKDAKPIEYEQDFQAAADITLDASRKFVLVPDMKAGTLTWLPIQR